MTTSYWHLWGGGAGMPLNLQQTRQPPAMEKYWAPDVSTAMGEKPLWGEKMVPRGNHRHGHR